MLYSLRNKFKKAWFDARCRDILSAPPIRPKAGLRILSAVGSQDIIMYLVAIKSFHRFLNHGEVILLLQNDCPDEALGILNEHVRPVAVFRDRDVELGRCPRGGTWERLSLIARSVGDGYVIQLDADTLTCGDLDEVLGCIRSNTSFMISTWKDQAIEPIDASCRRAKSVQSSHVQAMAERGFDRLANYRNLRYARGQSSFAGFAAGSISHESLEQFSVEMERIVGQAKWREWGSESVASNFMVANSPAATMLPYPRFATYHPGRANYDESALLHFEGTNRFKNGLYIEKARRMIGVLREPDYATA